MMIFMFMMLTMILMVIDLGIKVYVEENIAKGEEQETAGGRIIIRKVYNKGMALNLFENHSRDVFTVSAFTTAILTIYQFVTLLRKGNPIKKLGLSLMTAGAWSNIFDRLVRHYVVDYFSFKTKWKKFADITFNLGDMFIIAGSVLVVVATIFKKKKQA